MNVFTKHLDELLSNPLRVFILLSITFSISFALINPPGFGLDERAHFIRAFVVSEGHFMPTRLEGQNRLGYEIPDNLARFITASTMDLLDNNGNYQIIYHRKDTDHKVYEAYKHKTFSKNYTYSKTSNDQLVGTYNYSPISYLYIGGVVWVAKEMSLSILHTLIATRIMNIILFVAIAGIAIRIAPVHKWLLTSVALLPVALFQSSTVSVDPIINALAFLIFAFLLRFWYLPNKAKISVKSVMLVAMLLGLLSTMKQPYILLTIPFMVIGAEKFGSKRKEIFGKIILWLVPLSAVLLWAKVNLNVARETITAVTEANFNQQLLYVINNPLLFIKTLAVSIYQEFDFLFSGATGYIGDRFVGLQVVIIAVCVFLTIGLATLIPHRKQFTHQKDIANSRTNILVFVITIAGLVTGISLALYLGFSPVKSSLILGLQGRYFIPLIPLLALIAYGITPIKTALSEKTIIRIIVFSSFMLLFGTTILYYFVNY